MLLIGPRGCLLLCAVDDSCNCLKWHSEPDTACACTGCTWLHSHKGSWGQRADVVDYINYNMHDYDNYFIFFYLLRTIALSMESCSALMWSAKKRHI